MAERACVMEIGQDFVAGIWDVECFCGWEPDTGYDEREDAVRAWERHRADVSGSDLSRATGVDQSVGIGPDR